MTGTKALPGLIFAILTVISWSGFNVASKFAIDHGFSAPLLSFMRFGVAGLFLVPAFLWWVPRGKPVPKPYQIAILSLFGGPLFGILAVAGYHFSPLSHGLLFAPTAVFMVGSLIGILVLKEPAGRSFFIGAVLMLAGLVTLSGFDVATVGIQTLKGDLFFMLAGCCWAIFTNLMRHWRIDPVGGTIAVGSLSGLMALPVYLVFGSDDLSAIAPRDFMIQAVMQGIVGGICSFVFYLGVIRSLGASRASLLPATTPATALFMAFLIFGDMPNSAEIAGIILVTTGLMFAMTRQRPR